MSPLSDTTAKGNNMKIKIKKKKYFPCNILECSIQLGIILSTSFSCPFMVNFNSYPSFSEENLNLYRNRILLTVTVSLLL